MTYRWNTRLHLDATALKLLIDDDHGDTLKARLPPRPHHPRALLTLLEGLALWSGQPLHAAISAATLHPPSSAAALFGDDLAPLDSALVRFDFVDPPERRRRRRISGVGDFRQLYLLGGTR